MNYQNFKWDHLKNKTIYGHITFRDFYYTLKYEDEKFYCPAWCLYHKKMEWHEVKAFQSDEVFMLIEFPDTIEEYEEWFTRENQEKKIGMGQSEVR